tara:strand:+ start:37 stop:657 length:621 start_codon:yes stop_codon:yes gene_type:complete
LKIKKELYLITLKNLSMKKLILLVVPILFLSSCGSIFSVVGNKEKNIKTKCDNCFTTNKYYKSYGEAELKAGPRVKMAAISQARTYARNEMVKMLGTEGMSIAAQIAETKTQNNNTNFKENLTEAFLQQAYAMLENTEDVCLETKLSTKKGKLGKTEYVVANVCVQMSKKEYADNVYRENKEMFSNAQIDYETYSIILSGRVQDKK